MRVNILGSFSEDLLEWWRKNGRHFPWRETRDPYRILIAEILLHRTRAGNVVPVYRDFISRFPDIRTLVDADQDDVLRVTAPLGLRWRSMLIREAIEQIFEKYGGKIPCDLEILKQLQGVGEYIASAIMIFSCRHILPLLDTNTVRITGRYFGLKQVDGSRRAKQFHEYILSLIDPKEISESYYALIDLGALICKPANPECQSCPLGQRCKYFSKRRKDVR